MVQSCLRRRFLEYTQKGRAKTQSKGSSEALLAKESRANGFAIEGKIRPENAMIRNAHGIGGYCRHGLFSSRIGFRAVLHEDLPRPRCNVVDDVIDTIVFFRILMSRGIPVVVGK